MSRRERVREGVREEIKAIGRQQMAQQGTAALSLTAIARQMELTTPALYRYYADRDALITALIIDAFASVAAAMEDAAASVPNDQYAAQLLAVIHAYRNWALAHPVDFQLIYGNPIPGYHAPEDQTVPQVRRGAAVIMSVLQRAYQAGALRLPPELQTPNAALQLRETEHSGWQQDAVAPAVVYLCMAGWTRIHGIVMLELFNHLQPTVGDVATFYQLEMTQFLASIGLDLPNTS